MNRVRGLVFGIGVASVVGLCAGCGPRVHLTERFGVLSQRLFQRQADMGRAAQQPEAINGEEAELIVRSARARLAPTGDANGLEGGGSGSAGGSKDAGFVLRSR